VAVVRLRDNRRSITMAKSQDNIKQGRTKQWNGIGMSRKHDAFKTGKKVWAAKGKKTGSKGL